MKIVQIEEHKMGEISQGIEEMLRIGGRLMSCVEELEEQGEESGMGYRGGGGYRMGYRGGQGGGSAMGYRSDGMGAPSYQRPMRERSRGEMQDPYYM